MCSNDYDGSLFSLQFTKTLIKSNNYRLITPTRVKSPRCHRYQSTVYFNANFTPVARHVNNAMVFMTNFCLVSYLFVYIASTSSTGKIYYLYFHVNIIDYPRSICNWYAFKILHQQFVNPFFSHNNYFCTLTPLTEVNMQLI